MLRLFEAHGFRGHLPGLGHNAQALTPTLTPTLTLTLTLTLPLTLTLTLTLTLLSGAQFADAMLRLFEAHGFRGHLPGLGHNAQAPP